MTQFKPHISMPGALGFGGGIGIGPGDLGKLALALWGVPPWYTEFARDDKAYSIGLDGEPVEVQTDVHTEALDTGVREYLNYAGTQKCECDGVPIDSVNGVTNASIITDENGVKWYEIDNSLGASIMFSVISGFSGNTNIQTFSVVSSIVSGTGSLTSIAVVWLESLVNGKTHKTITAQSPTDRLTVAADPFSIIRFRLPQMTETDYLLPDIVSSKDGPVIVNQPHLKLQASGTGARTINGKTVQDIFNGAADGVEKIVNGDFDSSDGWNLGSSWVIENSRATCDGILSTSLNRSISINNNTQVLLCIELSGVTGNGGTLFVGGTLFISDIGALGNGEHYVIGTKGTQSVIGVNSPVGSVFSIETLSVQKTSPATGTTVHKAFKTAQVLQPDIPRTLAIASGSPVITDDQIDWIDESASVTDTGYWNTEKTYQVNVTLSGYSGTGDITLPFDGAVDETDAYGNDLNVSADGTYEYIYTPTTDLLQTKSAAGHTATLTINFIKEVQTLLNTNTDVPIFYIDPTTGLLVLTDGMDTAVSSSPLSDDTYHNFHEAHYIDKMHVTIDGDKGIVGTFSGSFPDVGEFLKYTDSGVLHRVEAVCFEDEPQFAYVFDGDEQSYDALYQSIEYL